jgi:UDP-N-acetylglucosamine acyltransferase
MAVIDPTARIEPGATVGQDVSIGPYCIIGPNVAIGDGCRLLAHVHLAGHTTIGRRTVIYPFASLGTPPQSSSYRGGATRLVVGAQCDIREGVTMNTGTETGRGVTEVGDRGFFMAYSHIGHDCRIGNDVVFANNASLAGHCVVGDHVFMGGLSAAHQFTRIGAHAMISGVTALRGDVIPFGIAAGAKGRLIGINAVGMKRREFSPGTIRAVRAAYRQLFFGEGVLARRLEAVEAEFGDNDAVARVIAFVREARSRPLCYPGNRREV